MYTEQEETRRWDVVSRYIKREGRITRGGTLIGGIVAATFMFGGVSIGTHRLDHNPFADTRAVKEYQNATNTLSYLQNEESKLGMIDLESQPENIKPHLEKVLKGRLERTKSLEKAIELTEANIERLSQEPDYIKKEEYINNSNYIFIGGFGAGFISLLSTIAIIMNLSRRGEKRMYEELKAEGLSYLP